MLNIHSIAHLFRTEWTNNNKEAPNKARAGKKRTSRIKTFNRPIFLLNTYQSTISRLNFVQQQRHSHSIHWICSANTNLLMIDRNKIFITTMDAKCNGYSRTRGKRNKRTPTTRTRIDFEMFEYWKIKATNRQRFTNKVCKQCSILCKSSQVCDAINSKVEGT